MLDALFALSFVVPAPFWLVLIVFPKRAFTRRWFGTGWFHAGFVALGAMYLFVLVGSVVGGIAAGGFGLDKLTSLSGLTSLASNPAFVLALWLHVVTMDLAGGFYIYRAAQDIDLGGLTLSLILFFTLLLGPLGIMMFALTRMLYGMRQQMQATQAQ
jgi:Domain of unknown function (DUF4281)